MLLLIEYTEYQQHILQGPHIKATHRGFAHVIPRSTSEWPGNSQEEIVRNIEKPQPMKTNPLQIMVSH